MEAFRIRLGYNLTGLKVPERLTAAQATAGFFKMLGVNAERGRAFLPGDDSAGAPRVVLLTHAFAVNHFGGESPLDKQLLLDDVPYSVIGVLPPEFHLPALAEGTSEYKADVWVPLPAVSVADEPRLAKGRRLQVCARLKPNVSLDQAREEMKAIAARLADENPDLDRGYGATVFPLEVENMSSDLRGALHIFSAAAALMLLLACVNLAGLALVHSAERKREFAIMAALGAGRWALISPILVQSAILATVAGVFGFLAAFAGIRLVIALKPTDIFGPERLALNWHVFVFNVGIAALTVLIFGLIPAWLTSGGDLGEVLKSRAGGGSRPSPIRGVFMAVQIALSLTLALAAVLVARSLQSILRVDLGYRLERVLTAHVALSPQRYAGKDDQIRFSRQLRERLQLLPGVESVALADNLPLYSLMFTGFEIEGRAITEANARPSADLADVTPNFFGVMGVPLREGRLFTEQDAEFDPPNAVIVNEALAHRFWPNQSPVGSHIRRVPVSGLPGPWHTVIGVVGDYRQFNVETPARPELFWPVKAWTGMSIVLRTAGDPALLSSSLQQTVWAVDHDEPVSDIQTFGQIVGDYNSQRRFNVLALGSFAVIGILLTLVGMFGLIASLISSRTRDIGIRFALGAQRAQVYLSLLRPSLVPVLAGIGLGLLFSFFAKHLIAAVLFETSPLDPLTYFATPAAFLAILILTGLAATRRAARIDPARVLRQE
jgi:putative ABC transport system permease protein